MVSPFRNIFIVNMSFRYNGNRNISRLEAFRELADDIVSRSHALLSRSDSRSNRSPLYTMTLEAKYTSKKARVIGVILFTLSLFICAILMGSYYMFAWHPRTNRLFHKQNGTSM